MAALLRFVLCCFAISAQAQALIDPTLPSGGRGAGPAAPAIQTGPQVSLTLTHGQAALAVVDGEVVRAGSNTAHGVVDAIRSDAVCFRQSDGVRKCVPVFPPEAVGLRFDTSLKETQSAPKAATKRKGRQP